MTIPTKGEQTRTAILDEALRIASRLGLEGLTIGSLADATGMSKSGLFAHFGSREDLQLAVLEHAAQRAGVQTRFNVALVHRRVHCVRHCRNSPLAALNCTAAGRGLRTVKPRGKRPDRRCPEGHDQPRLNELDLQLEPWETCLNLGAVRPLVQAAFAALALEQREVLELAYFSGLSHGDIAARLELPLGTVKTRIRLGMVRLRELLRPLVE